MGRPGVLLLPILLLAGCHPAERPPRSVRWKPMDAGPNNVIRHGPIALAVEDVEVRTLRQSLADGEAARPAFVVRTRTTYYGGRGCAAVWLPPLQTPCDPGDLPAIVLEDDQGRRYDFLNGDTTNLDLRTSDIRLDADDPDVWDELHFDPAAGEAHSLTLTIPSYCRARDANGQDTPQPLDRPPFRFRLLRWMWADSP